MWARPSVLTDLALLALRAMAGAIFASSGWSHLRNPEERSRSIGMGKGFTIFLGAAEILGSAGLVFGVLARLAALGLILIMLGAIRKKILVWHTGFWGKDGYGWHYDLMIAVVCLVVFATGGGRLVLWN